jgi:ubiquitin carboxyl-terminal hydrolase 10
VSFASAVLQLLVYCPLFWDLFRDVGRLIGQRGEEETGGGATPLVDATVRFVEEFMFKEKETPPMQQQPQQLEDEEGKKERNAMGSFEPTYLYDAMKGKRQLKSLLVRFHNQDAVFCY